MRKIATTAAALALGTVLAAAPAAADSIMTGEFLYEGCAARHDVGQGLCAGYITGVAHYAELDRLLGVRRVCRPAGVTNGQISDVVVAYLRDHPAERHAPAVLVVLDALEDAWLCD